MTGPIARLFSGALLAGLSGAGALAAEALDCVIEPKAIVDLMSTDKGMLREILVSRGDVVTRGMVVARLDNELERLNLELARIRANSDANLRSQQARLNLRRVELERAEGLRNKGVASGAQVEEAQIEKTLSELSVEDAKTQRRVSVVELRQARARLERRALRSPVDGVVMSVDASPGEFANEQSVVMRIAEINPLHVEVFVPATLYGALRIGQSFEVVLAAPIGGRHTATVSVVDSVFDAASGTFGVRLILPNPDGAIPAGVRCSIDLTAS